MTLSQKRRQELTLFIFQCLEHLLAVSNASYKHCPNPTPLTAERDAQASSQMRTLRFGTVTSPRCQRGWPNGDERPVATAYEVSHRIKAGTEAEGRGRQYSNARA